MSRYESLSQNNSFNLCLPFFLASCVALLSNNDQILLDVIKTLGQAIYVFKSLLRKWQALRLGGLVMKYSSKGWKFVFINLFTTAIMLPALVRADGLETLRPIESLKLTVSPDDGANEVLNILSKAKSSVKMMMYHLSNKKVIQKLKDLAKKGIHIQIILDSDGLTYNCHSQGIANDLTQNGIEVFWSTPEFSLMHVKSFLVDDSILWLSTMNLTQAIYFSMRDFSITTKDALLVSDFQQVFAADVKNSINKSKESPTLQDPNIVLSPINALTKIVDLINSAQSSIDLIVENLGSTDVQKALLNALQRKVKVRLLTPDCAYLDKPEKNDSSLKELVAAGAQSHVMPESNKNNPYIHAKILNIDSKKIFLGSENFSNNSLNWSRELGVIFISNPISKEIQTVFDRDWSDSVDFSVQKTGRCPLPPPPPANSDGKPPVCDKKPFSIESK